MGDEVPGLCGPIRPEGMNNKECKFRLTGKQDTKDQVRVSSHGPIKSLGVVVRLAQLRIGFRGSTQ
jgi:hypothetical protein